MRKRYIYCDNTIPCLLDIYNGFMFYSPKWWKDSNVNKQEWHTCPPFSLMFRNLKWNMLYTWLQRNFYQTEIKLDYPGDLNEEGWGILFTSTCNLLCSRYTCTHSIARNYYRKVLNLHKNLDRRFNVIFALNISMIMNAVNSQTSRIHLLDSITKQRI